MRRGIDMFRPRQNNFEESRSSLRQEEARFPRRRNLSEGTMSMLRRYNDYATHYENYELLLHQFRDATASSRNAQSASTSSGTVTIEIRRNSFIPYDVELNQTREATFHPNVARNPHPTSSNPENADDVENRSADDSSHDEPPTNAAARRDQEANTINDELPRGDSHQRDELYERLNNAWVRVNERSQAGNSQNPDRRINLCYRNLIDQYVTLVRRYFDVSRNRDTVSYTMVKKNLMHLK